MKLQFQVGATVLVLGAIALSFYVGGCKHRKEEDRLNMALYDAKKEVTSKELIIRDQKVTIFKSEAQIVSSQKALKQSQEEKEYLRKLHIKDVQSITNLTLEIEVLKKQGVYRDTVIIRDTVTNVVDTVKQASYKDQWLNVSVLLYPKKPEFNVKLYTPIKCYIGYQGVFNNKPTVLVTTTNPYVQITKANTVIVEADKGLLHKKYPYLIAGFVGGWLIFK
jgi:hypothetical protein